MVGAKLPVLPWDQYYQDSGITGIRITRIRITGVRITWIRIRGIRITGIRIDKGPL